MTKKDFGLGVVIGVAVGLLSQLLINNLSTATWAKIPVSHGLLRVGVVVFFGVLAPFALFVASLIAKKISFVFQFAKFAAVGSLNSFVDLGILNLLTWLVSANPSQPLFVLFKSISFISATTNSYLWNRAWTFQATNAANAKEGLQFYVIAGINYFINVGVATAVRGALLSAGVIDAGLVTNIIAPVCGFLVAFVSNFLGYKFIVFKSNRE